MYYAFKGLVALCAALFTLITAQVLQFANHTAYNHAVFQWTQAFTRAYIVISAICFVYSLVSFVRSYNAGEWATTPETSEPVVFIDYNMHSKE
jgi:hypothetical protein